MPYASIYLSKITLRNEELKVCKNYCLNCYQLMLTKIAIVRLLESACKESKMTLNFSDMSNLLDLK